MENMSVYMVYKDVYFTICLGSRKTRAQFPGCLSPCASCSNPNNVCIESVCYLYFTQSG